MRTLFAALLVTVACSLASGASAFTTSNDFLRCDPGGEFCDRIPGGGTLNVAATIAYAPRWSATPVSGGRFNNVGLHDGVQVGIESGFAAAFGANPAESADIEARIVAAFDAWDNGALTFDTTFDETGHEIDLFAVDGRAHWAFENNDYLGRADFHWMDSSSRTLTNGEVVPGGALLRGEVYIAWDRVLALKEDICSIDGAPGCTNPYEIDLVSDGFQRLLMHEIGHVIGLAHPWEFAFANLDTDDNPLNVIDVDPLDPFAGLAVSTNVDVNAVMTTSRPPGRSVLANFFTELQPDDVSGRDVLYPIPEPSTALLLATGLAGLAAAGRRRSLR